MKIEAINTRCHDNRHYDLSILRNDDHQTKTVSIFSLDSSNCKRLMVSFISIHPIKSVYYTAFTKFNKKVTIFYFEEKLSLSPPIFFEDQSSK